MAHVTLTANLQKYYPKQTCEIEGSTLLEVLQNMEQVRPHFMSYLIDDRQHIRAHVNVFLDSELLQDKTNLDVQVLKNTKIHFMQALSGG